MIVLLVPMWFVFYILAIHWKENPLNFKLSKIINQPVCFGKKKSETKLQLNLLREFLFSYTKEIGHYPNNSELNNFVEYLRGKIRISGNDSWINDSWGEPIRFSVIEETIKDGQKVGVKYKFYSTGENMTDEQGTGDDIVIFIDTICHINNK